MNFKHMKHIKRINIKRVMIVGTMIVAMSFGGTAWGKPSLTASPVAKWSTSASVNDKDELLEALNQSSNEELYEALYDGKSLHDIALANGGDIDSVIQLQVNQLALQLDARLASGSITSRQHAEQKAELVELVTQSVHTTFG